MTIGLSPTRLKVLATDLISIHIIPTLQLPCGSPFSLSLYLSLPPSLSRPPSLPLSLSLRPLFYLHLPSPVSASRQPPLPLSLSLSPSLPLSLLPSPQLLRVIHLYSSSLALLLSVGSTLVDTSLTLTYVPSGCLFLSALLRDSGKDENRMENQLLTMNSAVASYQRAEAVRPIAGVRW